MNIQELMVQEGYFMKAVKQVSKIATAVRLVQYPDGRQIVQGGFMWHEGFKSGMDWMDLPVILVDSKGQEFQEESE